MADRLQSQKQTDCKPTFITLGPRTKNIAGQCFGRLTALGPVSTRQRPGGGIVTIWLCRCDCGASHTVDGQELRAGKSRSCGCLQRETIGEIGRRTATKHGLCESPEYEVWAAMIQRCTNPSAQEYPRYGARGISVCERWRDFAHFIEDMGPRSSPDHSIDRKDNNGNYEPSNCRWATRKQQDRNKRSNRIVTAFGRTGPLETFIKGGSQTLEYRRAYNRLARGWSAEDALSVPPLQTTDRWRP